MGFNATPSANRIHIGFFGKRNSGKSSLVNAVTGQELAVVSDIKGTTTDPVYKAMELLPLGPVVIIDTPGIDDEGALGELRIRKTRQVLSKTDIAVLVIDSCVGKTDEDEELIQLFEKRAIPYIIVYNKSDLKEDEGSEIGHEIHVSAKTGYGVNQLKEKIAAIASAAEPERRLVGDLLSPMDLVVLVVPIDSSAPKGRLILPQQQTIRDILDAGAVAIAVKDTEYRETLEKLGEKPRLIITDSQVFERVSAITPGDVFLTSFSILFTRYKGNLKTAVKGARALDKLQDGDTVLISEGCTHHRQCEDIGTVKLPRWIKEYTKKQLEFRFTSGTEFPEILTGYKLVVHCGGCMLNEREMKHRTGSAVDQHVPITNYGVLIAYMKGILERSIAVFPEV
ncbi:MAG: [FeFe] hydrogenase H-cluster maturation GTPase HydF [Clostridiaceae bacterium]|jgi:[FeFe] hydrogenase H-cluster maturation GTPase HydF|nr:[FeFe] hydrogenase H-cluster maturation GTPase HydF [Clostridiaceae bacterium]